jgi:hypothetical protein
MNTEYIRISETASLVSGHFLGECLPVGVYRYEWAIEFVNQNLIEYFDCLDARLVLDTIHALTLDVCIMHGIEDA